MKVMNFWEDSSAVYADVAVDSSRYVIARLFPTTAITTDGKGHEVIDTATGLGVCGLKDIGVKPESVLDNALAAYWNKQVSKVLG